MNGGCWVLSIRHQTSGAFAGGPLRGVRFGGFRQMQKLAAGDLNGLLWIVGRLRLVPP